MELVLASNLLSEEKEDGSSVLLDSKVVPFELDYTPNNVSWMPSTHMSRINNEDDMLLVSGYYDFDKPILQLFKYNDNNNNNNNKSKNENENENVPFSIEGLNMVELESIVSDISFANNQIGIISQINGTIDFIKLNQENNNSGNDDWDIESMNRLKCVNNYEKETILTSLSISQIRGMLAACDECGFVYFAGLDYENEKSNSIKCKQLCRSAIYDIIFVDSDTIGIVNMSNEFSLWDTRTKMNKANYFSKIDCCIYGSLHCVSNDPTKNDRFVIGTQNGHVLLWDIKQTNNNNNMIKSNEKDYSIIYKHESNTIVNELQFINDNNILSCGNDGAIALTNLEKIEKMGNINANKNFNDNSILYSDNYPMTSMHFNQQLNIVAACSDKQCLVMAQL